MPANFKNIATTSDFKGFLNPERSKDIFEEAARQSIVQSVARKIPISTNGNEFIHFEGDVTANWVAETEKKPLTKGGFGTYAIKPYKIATIFAMSSEVVRADPENYINTMRTKVAEAFAKAFDAAALWGDGPFEKTLKDVTKTVALGTGQGAFYNGLNSGLSLLAEADKKWTATLMDSRTEPIINGSLDSAGRPLFVEAPYTETNAPFRRGRALGRELIIADGLKKDTTLGFMGDFSKIVWGQIGGITYDVTDQATLDLSDAQDGSGLVSLWQNNLVAVRCETEYALLVHDPDAFVKVTA